MVTLVSCPPEGAVGLSVKWPTAPPGGFPMSRGEEVPVLPSATVHPQVWE